ncbi:uncharacterized protein AB675_6252 [Cyphellophora attinorum]|uniref:Uncharacterized protein n=1 Tax=Cyphellophora attinorum TaxID=1664694 RepID=A0A0N1HYS2_9EURO|nr:uncharacterized protein AB675_6252 [Phialophora attinorum]KPI43703.1 hypothetical protein AB675_6252 [Phialophora attinorum]
MSRHPLHQMLDIAFKLLPELVEYQGYLSPSRKSASPPAKWATKETQSRIQHLQKVEEQQSARERLRRLRAIASELDHWEADFRVQQQQRYGGLHHRQEAEWAGLYEYSFGFTSLPAATAYTMYAAIRIRLAEAIYTSLCICNKGDSLLGIINSRPPLSRNGSAPNVNVLAATQSTSDAMMFLMTAEIAPPPLASSSSSSFSSPQTEKMDALLQGLRWARQSLQSLEFFHTGSLKDCGWVATLFAFDSAWSFVNNRRELDGHVDLSRERIWCQDTARRFEALQIPLFGWR